MSSPSCLALIPARGGSKGLPGKNIRPLAGLPLIAHSIQLARLCPEISRVVVSTDSQEIISVAQKYGAETPFVRPAELAADDTPMWPVIRHALQSVEERSAQSYDYLVLLDPTSPGRLPEDIHGAIGKLHASSKAVGIIGVSQPEFNPIWHCVVEKDGFMSDMFEDGSKYNRRQDLPTVYRINATLYIWKADFVRNEPSGWRQSPHLMYEVPEARAIHIDDVNEFERADLMIRNGMIRLPWLNEAGK
jgi:N-acylneuraminate cytidylyltransferase